MRCWIENWMVKVEHIYREGNPLAGFFVGIGHSLSIDVHSVFISNPFYHIILCMIFLEFPTLV
ncbi:hypothetical protein LINPERPRIM_LOCUS29445 [Linum perenne]